MLCVILKRIVANKFKNKRVSYKKRGDKIEIKLYDPFWNIFYEKQVSLNDKDGLKQLMTDLKHYGIDLTKITKKGTDWFE